ncbi:MAG: 2-oxoglutarate dehydrogenase complex dihydrolipoyllysine-residue succinyltransferase [Planctomycetota bacterium]|nr:MAG: 2-oxoglutarate dehydrogenase complex dihydrolipoyllysine-residue succinyltransferase [Planctomycetota bacterium]
MPTELKVPAVGESITEVVLSKWTVQPGQRAKKDEPLVVIETDKVTVELPAPADGVLVKISKGDGSKAAVGEVIGVFEEGAGGAAPASKPAEKGAEKPAAKQEAAAPAVMPAAARVIAQQGLGEVAGSGPGGRVLKEDAERAASAKASAPAPTPAQAPTPASTPTPTGARHEEVVAMTPLRKRIAERLVHAQSTAAMLTTFNEIDMSAVIELRKSRNDDFQKRHGVKLGFMSFFVKAAVDALALVPQVNAEVRGDAIVYKDYFDIGVAVGGGKGLLVPILRNAETLSFAEIEKKIGDLGKRAQENKIGLDELTGGTFTISNGGIYGSMMSTPILNPPQSGILGLHAINERAVVRDGQIVARPMMYVALTYDHRIVDGREAVTFLKRIKDCIEDPTRMLLEV